tara:strand:- start:971 stop:1408 length:438 start_codon:yes stop_codon:yes gene_type:complete
MAIVQAVANSFKKEILQGEHKFQSGSDVFKLALYTSAANLSAATTAYPGDSTGGQHGNTGSYTQGGGTLTGQNTSLDTGVAIVDFAELSFTSVTMTVRGALIYNTSASNKAVAVLDFGGDKTATAGTFTIQFPSFTSTNAILRIS